LKGGVTVAYKITEECLACGNCLEACPSEAIEEGDVYRITGDCVECGLCVEDCPHGAIVEE